jgi:hypothetical protein
MVSRISAFKALDDSGGTGVQFYFTPAHPFVLVAQGYTSETNQAGEN